MFTTLRKFTVIFLAILQLIAPLVHAHVGEKIGILPDSGVGTLHVPGLERYSVDRDASAFQVETLHCNVSTHDFNSDGMLIGIDTGIKDRQASVWADLDNSYYLHQQALAFNAAISPFDTIIPSQSQLFAHRLLIPSLSPRAPPAQ
ncbi:MAG TPA: hypothetical protein VIF37_06030 [Methylobacter sp.]|jgi:hypothetical protein